MTVITTINLTALNKKELKALAREFYLPGFSRLTREELVTGLTNIQNLYLRAEASCDKAEVETKLNGWV